MVGTDGSGEGVVWSSSDAEHWTQSSQGVDFVDVWGKVVFVHDRFLALGFSMQSAGVCQAPLSCLAVQAAPSVGPPPPQPMICTASCAVDADCPSWEATGFCAGPVTLRCADGACQPRSCE